MYLEEQPVGSSGVVTGSHSCCSAGSLRRVVFVRWRFVGWSEQKSTLKYENKWWVMETNTHSIAVAWCTDISVQRWMSGVNELVDVLHVAGRLP